MSNEARKGVLVINMPESCSKCQFIYEYYGIKKCLLMNVLYKGKSELQQNNFTIYRHEKCPLRELPEKKPYNGEEAVKGLSISERANKAIHEAAALSWNACIDAIMGGIE